MTYVIRSQLNDLALSHNLMTYSKKKRTSDKNFKKATTNEEIKTI